MLVKEYIVGFICKAVFCLGFSLSPVLADSTNLADPENVSVKPRLIILADMGNEPDEEQQMAHMLVNCNEFDLEGLVAVTGKYLNEYSKNEYRRVVHPELFHKLIDGYAQVESNLRLHADGWPTAKYLRSIVCSGQPKYGLADVGPGKASAGSKRIVDALVKDDPRPLHVVVNAGSNTLAQALVDLRTSRSDEEMSKLVQKLRVFENGAQDNCGAWICREFPDIHWIRSNHQTYGYMGESKVRGQAAGPWCWKPHPRTHQGQHRWAEDHIMKDHGAIGDRYPYRFDGNGFVEGGGTIPWLGLVNKGLYSSDHPSWGGWSGRFTSEKRQLVWSRHESVRRDEKTYGMFAMHTEATDSWKDPDDGTVYDNDFAAVWRWRQAMMNNCAARFDWCVCPRDEANHHPCATIDEDCTNAFVYRKVKPSSTLKIDASASTDPDGDGLTFRWYFYPEAGSYMGDMPTISDEGASTCSFQIPHDAAGKQLHLILEVTDQSKIIPLTDYRRIIIQVE